MSEKLVITIGRQYGSGGREVGHKLAELLGCKCYDQDLIVMAAKRSGISEEALALADEQASSSLLYTLAMGASMIYTSTTPMAVPINDALFIAQSEIIRELSETETCVIVGRCADYILEERDDCLHVFIHADKEIRAKRIVEKYGETPDVPEKRLNDKDKKRRNNYKYYTDREWGMSQNYDISLDSGALGLEKCADIIVDLAKNL